MRTDKMLSDSVDEKMGIVKRQSSDNAGNALCYSQHYVPS